MQTRACRDTQRTHLNRMENIKLSKERQNTRPIKPPVIKRGFMANMPHEMQVWRGMQLQSCMKQFEANSINALEYAVLGATDK